MTSRRSCGSRLHRWQVRSGVRRTHLLASRIAPSKQLLALARRGGPAGRCCPAATPTSTSSAVERAEEQPKTAVVVSGGPGAGRASSLSLLGELSRKAGVLHGHVRQPLRGACDPEVLPLQTVCRTERPRRVDPRRGAQHPGTSAPAMQPVPRSRAGAARVSAHLTVRTAWRRAPLTTHPARDGAACTSERSTCDAQFRCGGLGGLCSGEAVARPGAGRSVDWTGDPTYGSAETRRARGGSRDETRVLSTNRCWVLLAMGRDPGEIGSCPDVRIGAWADSGDRSVVGAPAATLDETPRLGRSACIYTAQASE